MNINSLLSKFTEERAGEGLGAGVRDARGVAKKITGRSQDFQGNWGNVMTYTDGAGVQMGASRLVCRGKKANKAVHSTLRECS
jgi:hypothetical protein